MFIVLGVSAILILAIVVGYDPAMRMWHTKIEAWVLNEAGIEFDYEKYAKASKVSAARA